MGRTPGSITSGFSAWLCHRNKINIGPVSCLGQLFCMTTWIIFFRGINVGGRNRLPMKELVKLLTDNGYTKVRTYIQSGNLVLQSGKTTAGSVAAHIGKLVSDKHGFRPGVFALRARELEAAILANPFPTAGAEPKSLHLYFLSRTPERPDLAAMERAKSASESFLLRDTVLYLHAPEGIARSRLAARLERLLGVEATARNWRTANKILTMVHESG